MIFKSMVNRIGQSEVHLNEEQKEKLFEVLLGLSHDQIDELKSKFQGSVDGDSKIMTQNDFSLFLIDKKLTNLMELFNPMFSLSQAQKTVFVEYVEKCKKPNVVCSFNPEDLQTMGLDEKEGQLFLQAALKYSINEIRTLLPIFLSYEKIDINVISDFKDTLSCKLCRIFTWTDLQRSTIVSLITQVIGATTYIDSSMLAAIKAQLGITELQAESILILLESMDVAV